MKTDEVELKPRSAQEAAQRLLALIAATSRVNEDRATRSLSWVQKNGIDAFFSDNERAFYYSPERPPERKMNQVSWRAEAIVALIWALGGMEEMPPRNELVDFSRFPLITKAMKSPADFIRDAQLRSSEEIEEMESTLFHEHWSVRDAELYEKPMPPELTPGIVYERRYALSWLVGWGDDWDHVPTDT